MAAQDAVVRHARDDLGNVPGAANAPRAEYTAGEAVGAFAKGVGDAVMSAAEKLIPQGAAEVAQALYTGNAYVPYGPTDAAVPMEGVAQAGDSYDQMLDQAAARGSVHGQEQQRVLER